MSFKDAWLEAVKKKGSVLCAGFDPVDFAMREKETLPEDADRYRWAMSYLAAVAPHVAAVKYNTNFWQQENDESIVRDVVFQAHKKDLVVIEDSKLRDVGSSNAAGLFYAAQRGADAVTFSPFAGNMQDMSNSAKEKNIGVISMCLMSNPEFANKKDMLVRVNPVDYDNDDIVVVDSNPYVHNYKRLAHDARLYKMDGIVIGAPGGKSHITEFEIDRARYYAGDDMLILLPGVGAQGGEAAYIWNYFDPDNVIVNVSRALMFPKGGDHATAAEHYKNMLNKLRRAT